MDTWPYDDDRALLTELGEALRERDVVPEDFLASARTALTWRTVDAELTVAELVFDSACDPEPAGAVRSAGSSRTLAFRAGEVAVEIEVTEAGVVGHLHPACGGRVSLRTVAGVHDESPVDQVGSFTLAPPPRGPVRVQARTPRYDVATSWVRLG